MKTKPKHRRYPRRLAFEAVMGAVDNLIYTAPGQVNDKYRAEVVAVLESVYADMKDRLRISGGPSKPVHHGQS